MTQSRKASAAEAVVNVAIGYWIAIAAQCLIFPMFGIHASLAQNLWIGLAFTAVSLLRSYCLRRFFNWLHQVGKPDQHVNSDRMQP